MRKSLVLASAFALAMAAAKPTLAADTIQFDTNGAAAGGFMSADLFDWLPGNTLLVESATDPTKGTIYYQANLGVIEGGASGPAGDFTNGSCAVGNCFFTAVAGFSVNITQVNLGGAQGDVLNNITVDPTGGVNYFRIYANNTAGDNLSGNCFACGTQILSGTGISGSSNFIAHTAVTPVALDQSPDGNQWVGTSTITGEGATSVTVRVDSFDMNYFLNLVAGTSLAFSNTSQIAPYLQVNPARNVTTDGIGAPDKASNVGTINGVSTLETLLQSDANTSFQNVGQTVVPEPATLTLLGFGLLGSAAARRRKKDAKK